ncbi:MAG: HesA/MoeB/ThiF family protein [Thermoplasmataceae archaeon]
MLSLRYSRVAALREIGVSGVESLRGSKVALVGVGGTGSLVADLMVRNGIGKMILIDGDTIDISNIHRQILFKEHDVGQNKAKVAAKELRLANRSVQIEEEAEFLDEENAQRLLGGSNLIIDGTDNFRTRKIINKFAVSNGIPWIFQSAIGTIAQVKAVIPGKTSCFGCLHIPENAEEISCQDLGILPSAPHLSAALTVAIAVRILTGKEVDGAILTFDLWNGELHRVRADRDPNCEVCGRI